MKRKFAPRHYFGAALVAVAVCSIPVVGQTPGQNQTPMNQPSGSYSQPFSQSQVQHPFMYTPEGIPMNQRRNHLFTLKKDGAIVRIEREPGVPFSPEEVQQTMEARQTLQNAVALLKSPDADDAKKEEAKQLIAKYLKAEFQWDQDARREQVEKLEKQVDQLKKQLTKREESQDKLIELRLQLLENDASGLSFPESWANLSGGPSYGQMTGSVNIGPSGYTPYRNPLPTVHGNGMNYGPNQPPNNQNPLYVDPPTYPYANPNQVPAKPQPKSNNSRRNDNSNNN